MNSRGVWRFLGANAEFRAAESNNFLMDSPARLVRDFRTTNDPMKTLKSILALAVATALTSSFALAHEGGIHTKPDCSACCKQGKDAHCCAKCKDDKQCAPCCEKRNAEKKPEEKK